MEEKIRYLSDLNRDEGDRPEVIEQRNIYIDYLKRLLINKKEDENDEIRDK